MSHTRTHTEIEFANPHLTCDNCHRPVPAWHDNTRCGCDEPAANEPCGCRAGVASTCPSWSPVDGCGCEAKCRG